MHAQKYHPSMLTGAMLDAFLAKGWFRMGQALFTTHYLRFRQKFFPAIWLRYGLTESMSASLDLRIRKAEKKFTIQVARWKLDEEQESLFTLYREHSGLVMSPTLKDILLDQHQDNVFNTWQVTVRDGNKLIGLGIFDLGEHSVAGISNIYHPDYKKYSLGKMLMLYKIRYSLQEGYSWFYPGYAVPGYSRFDYKLEVMAGDIWYFDAPAAQWLLYNEKSGLPNYLEQMEASLESLMDRLRAENFNCRLVFYPPFDLALSDELLPRVIDVPMFTLLGYNDETETSTVAVFAPEKEGFSIVNCRPVIQNGWAFEGSKCICYDVLQVIDQTDAIFSEDEILKIMGTG